MTKPKLSKHPLTNLLFAPRPYWDYYVNGNKNAFKEAIEYYKEATRIAELEIRKLTNWNNIVETKKWGSDV